MVESILLGGGVTGMLMACAGKSRDKQATNVQFRNTMYFVNNNKYHRYYIGTMEIT